ncbi:hypothetical protein protein, partial [Bacillus cereus G9241]
IIPNTIINAVSFPNVCCAIATTASLFGIIPLIWNALSNILPKTSKAPINIVAPPPKTTKPIIVFKVPETVSAKFFFCSSKPHIANNPTNIAGCPKISFIIISNIALLPLHCYYIRCFCNASLISFKSKIFVNPATVRLPSSRLQIISFEPKYRSACSDLLDAKSVCDTSACNPNSLKIFFTFISTIKLLPNPFPHTTNTFFILISPLIRIFSYHF